MCALKNGLPPSVGYTKRRIGVPQHAVNRFHPVGGRQGIVAPDERQVRSRSHQRTDFCGGEFVSHTWHEEIFAMSIEFAAVNERVVFGVRVAMER